MKLLIAASLSVLALTAASAHADNHTTTANKNALFNNSTIELGYDSMDINGTDFTGFAFEAGKEFAVAGHNLFGKASYSKTTNSDHIIDFNFTDIRLSLGHQHKLNDQMVVDFELLYVTRELDAKLVSFEKDDLGVAATYKYLVNDTLVAYAGVETIDGEFGFKVGGEFLFKDQFSVGADFRSIDDTDTMGIFAKYRF